MLFLSVDIGVEDPPQQGCHVPIPTPHVAGHVCLPIVSWMYHTAKKKSWPAQVHRRLKQAYSYKPLCLRFAAGLQELCIMLSWTQHQILRVGILDINAAHLLLDMSKLPGSCKHIRPF